MFIVVTFIEEILAVHTLFSWWTSDHKYFESNRRIQLRGIVKEDMDGPQDGANVSDSSEDSQRKTAKIVSHMALAHELLMDDSFKLQTELPQNS